MEYRTLEPKSLSSLGVQAPAFNGGNTSFLATSTFLYTLFFVAIVGAAFYRYGVAGILRMQASEPTIRKSNEIIKQVTLGLLGVFSLFLILFTVNKGLITGDVGLEGLRVGGTTGSIIRTTTSPVSNTGTILTSSKSCESPDAVKSKITSPAGVCGGVRCTLLSGCAYNQFLPIIKEESAAAGIDYRITVVIMCRESRGVINPPQRTGSLANADGSFDCGLMQINRKDKVCDSSILDPRTNIRAGIQELKKSINVSAGRPITPGVPPLANAFADYNCCANGTAPSSPSNDCTQSAGFPVTLPKWACPINPGAGTFNMCAVKDYACETSNCIESVP